MNKAIDMEPHLCICCKLILLDEQGVEQNLTNSQFVVIWHTLALMWRHCNVLLAFDM